MRLPDELPYDFAYLAAVSDEEKLFQELQSKPQSLVLFFTYACEDEIWSNAFPKFMQLALQCMTDLFLQSRLPLSSAQQAAHSIQHHITNLKPLLPLNIVCELSDADIPINSLLFQAASNYFMHAIQTSCFEENSKQLKLFRVKLRQFEIIQEYVYTGDVWELWRLSEEELLKTLDLASAFSLPALREQCEWQLLRYITAANVFTTLETAYRNSWEIIKAECCQHANTVGSGIILEPLGPLQLSCQVSVITERSLETFAKIKDFVTLLICGPTIIENNAFGPLVSSCSKLRTVDLSLVHEFHTNLSLLPSRLFEVVLFGCPWLTDHHFKQLLGYCPNIQRLNLTNCHNLTATAWGELLKLPKFHALILTRCQQISDEDFILILRSARHLTELDISECRGISDQTLRELATSHLPLLELNLSRTAVSDNALLEICTRLSDLRNLDLTRCQNLSEQGIVEAIQQSNSLRQINITACPLPPITIEGLRQKMPNINIISN